VLFVGAGRSSLDLIWSHRRFSQETRLRDRKWRNNLMPSSGNLTDARDWPGVSDHDIRSSHVRVHQLSSLIFAMGVRGPGMKGHAALVAGNKSPGGVALCTVHRGRQPASGTMIGSGSRSATPCRATPAATGALLEASGALAMPPEGAPAGRRRPIAPSCGQTSGSSFGYRGTPDQPGPPLTGGPLTVS
jgi:hypothetical protein